MKALKNIAILLLISLMTVGCEELPLMKNEDLPSTPAGENNKTKTLWSFLQEDHRTDLTAIDLFARAVKHAGLQDILDGKEEYTIIISNNVAMGQLLATLGTYTTVEDVPPILLRNLLSDNIIKGRVRSFDLAENENKKFETINGGYLWMFREVGTSDQYRLYINNDPSLTVNIPRVRTQNLEFTNGAAHVVESFTYYRTKTPATSVVDPSKLDLKYEKVPITKDATLLGGVSANINTNDPAEIFFRTGTNVDSYRAGLLQFPVKTPSFGKIGAAKLYTYYFNSNTGSTLLTAINLYSDEDWAEDQVTFNNGPKLGQTLATFSINRAIQTIPNWYSYDVSAAYIQQLKNGKNFINLGINHPTNSTLKIRPREFSSGSFGAYIELSSAPPTILTAGNLNPLNVAKSRPFYVLSSKDLSLNGTTANNIIYKIDKLPLNGYLLKFGVPLKEAGEFSQADIENGGIKYLYGGTGANDVIILEPRDFQGGYYQLLNLNVSIQ